MCSSALEPIAGSGLNVGTVFDNIGSYPGIAPWIGDGLYRFGCECARSRDGFTQDQGAGGGRFEGQRTGRSYLQRRRMRHGPGRCCGDRNEASTKESTTHDQGRGGRKFLRAPRPDLSGIFMLATATPALRTHSKTGRWAAALAPTAKRLEDSRALASAVAGDQNGIGLSALLAISEKGTRVLVPNW